MPNPNRRRALVAGVLLAAALLAAPLAHARATPSLFPANGARQVNPDTQLKITFDGTPSVGASGLVRIYDEADGRLVDTLDLSIPPSPRPNGRMTHEDGSTKAPTPPAPAGPDNSAFQSDQIGGAWFHFFPVIVRGKTAIIQPHHNRLTYGRTYRVKIDPQVLQGAGAAPAALEWTFTTKAAPPKADAERVVVSADGEGDFNTVQGAIDFAPDKPAKPLEIFIRNGRYEELVHMTGKSNLVLRGQDRDKVVVGYANNSAFNRIRPAFTVTDSDDIQLSTFTIENYFIGQAEALLVRGERIVLDRMTLNGSGDAMTTYGSIYMVDSRLTGDGDTILAYATLYCLRCEIRSVGPFTWTRTPEGKHGNVFVESKFVYLDKPLPWSITPTNPSGTKTPGVLARLPRNGSASSPYANFPHAEMVLIDSLTDGVPPQGWGPIEDPSTFDWSNLRLMEFNTRDVNGQPIDLSKRHPAVRILTEPKDAQLIAQYRKPSFVFDGWDPVVR